MIAAGVTAARFDASVGTLEYHLKSLDMFHQAALRARRVCAICLDVAGRRCSVVQPFTLNDQGWPKFWRDIRINKGQTVALTVDGKLQLQHVRTSRLIILQICVSHELDMHQTTQHL